VAIDDLWDDGSESDDAQVRESGRERRTERTQRTETPQPRRARPDPDTYDDDDLRLEPAHIDLSFSVRGSPEPVPGTAGAPIPFDLEASDPDTNIDTGMRRRRTPTPSSPDLGPILISSGSEADEDNALGGAHAPLAYLHRGDFDAILRGRVVRSLDHAHGEARDRRRRERQLLRPPLRRRPFLTAGGGGGKLVQAQLDLPIGAGPAWGNGAVPGPEIVDVARRTGGQRRITDWGERREGRSERGERSERKRESERNERRDAKRRKTGHTGGGGANTKRGPRPAIRLDDTTIFANEEFAFDSDLDDPILVVPPLAPVVVGKRTFARVTSRSDPRSPIAATFPTSPGTKGAPAAGPRTPRAAAGANATTPRTACASTPAARLDDGVGKARSWANFDRFPIDFDITPLPSSVFLSDSVLTGLPAFLDDLRDADDPYAAAALPELKPLFAFGIDLHATMGRDEALAVMPIVLDGALAALGVCIENNPADDDAVLQSVLAPLSFFRDFFLRSDADSRGALYDPLRSFASRLDDIALSHRAEHRAAIHHLLPVRYALLQCALAAHTAVSQSAARLLGLLLTYGFDRTLRPVRAVLRGEADTPEITDRSAAIWVAAAHLLSSPTAQPAPGSQGQDADTDMLAAAVVDALEARYAGEIGPLAAERLWFIIFGLCVLTQFDASGTVPAEYLPAPRWGLVKRAIGLIKIAHSQEAEEAAQLGQLQGRDRYLKTMVARCLRLSSAWAWSFDRQSFSVATRDLGMIFKARGHRNLPTEAAADFPPFIAQYDISLSAADAPDSTRRASAFELYLRLACVAASDVIASAGELSEAHSAERDVQRLIMGILPLSSVPFTRASPPTPRQLAALVNRYSTMVVACYFSPSLLPWLLGNSAKWLDFRTAGFESRQVVVRGLMYLAVAVRHHDRPLAPVVGRLAEILAILEEELQAVMRGGSVATSGQQRILPSRVEIERTMVLVVTAFREVIRHAGYAPREVPAYPDPELLSECE
jgi:hypothetical protein